MSFLDIDRILSEEERIPCIFKTDAIGLGSLDPTSNSEDLPDGTKIELPLWLAEALLKKDIVTTELPKHFGQKMRNEILADASNINLREHSNYFFEVGIKLANLSNNKDLKQMLTVAFSGKRYNDLMVHALSSWNDDVTAFAQNLTNAENVIFIEGLKTARDLHDWRQTKSAVLKPSSILGRRTGDVNDSSDKQQHKRRL